MFLYIGLTVPPRLDDPYLKSHGVVHPLPELDESGVQLQQLELDEFLHLRAAVGILCFPAHDVYYLVTAEEGGEYRGLGPLHRAPHIVGHDVCLLGEPRELLLIVILGCCVDVLSLLENRLHLLGEEIVCTLYIRKGDV